MNQNPSNISLYIFFALQIIYFQRYHDIQLTCPTLATISMKDRLSVAVVPA